MFKSFRIVVGSFNAEASTPTSEHVKQWLGSCGEADLVVLGFQESPAAPQVNTPPPTTYPSHAPQYNYLRANDAPETKQAYEKQQAAITSIFPAHVVVADVAMGEPPNKGEVNGLHLGANGFIRIQVLATAALAPRLQPMSWVVPLDEMGNVDSLFDPAQPYPPTFKPFKGAVAVYLPALDLFLINCHLQATEAALPEAIFDTHRLSQLQTIQNVIGQKVYSTQTILFGDLNFRVELSTHEGTKTKGGTEWQAATALLAADAHATLFSDHDRLSKHIARQTHPAVQGFTDALTESVRLGSSLPKPTFKFNLHTPQREYHTKRCPGWTDRILFRNLPAQVLFQAAHEVTCSDHVPVCAVFDL
eukprot:NODE_2399_length_1187_cov_42.827358_g2285_i0.p1 GENE.NODE_2399_length_1187_cov_42.827358_g2285_i0~~NODE_2399_length_1187_cov_42.827358_g2285_i0.p1  ORF type:complete len:381 (+),score=81.31 NODE_2399_length_1187_cov_42.827358_g2285_i0:61-1143(+)